MMLLWIIFMSHTSIFLIIKRLYLIIRRNFEDKYFETDKNTIRLNFFNRIVSSARSPHHFAVGPYISKRYVTLFAFVKPTFWLDNHFCDIFIGVTTIGFMKFALTLFLLFTFTAYAQNTAASRLAEVKSLINSEPERAGAILKHMLNDQTLADTVRSDVYKYYGLYYNVKGQTDSTQRYLEKSLKMARKSPPRQIQLLINLASVYQKKNNLIKAEQLLIDAEAISRTNDNVLLGRIFGMKGSVYNLMLKEEDAFKYLKDAVSILKKEKDSVLLAAIQSSLAGSYMYKGNYQFAIDIYKEALAGFKKNKHDLNFYLTLINLADCYILTDRPTEAVRLLHEAITGFEKLGNEQMLVNAWWKLGKASAQTSEAISHYEKALVLSIKHESERMVNIGAEYIGLLLKHQDFAGAFQVISRIDANPLRTKANIEDRFFYEKQKANYFERTSNTRQAIQSFKTAFQLRDSLEEIRRDNEIREIQARYQNDLQREKNLSLQKNNRFLEEKNKASVKAYWLSLGLGFCLLVALLSLLIVFRYRSRLQSEKLKTAQAERELIRQQHESELQLNQVLQRDLHHKSQALLSAERTLKEFLSDIEQKNEQIKKYKTRLNTLLSNNAEEAIITEHKRELGVLLSKAIITEERWDAFLKIFLQVYPDYHKNIGVRLPGLTPAELRYITLRKLNLSAREIAATLGIQPDSLRLYRHRLRKKYGFQSDEELDAVLRLEE